MRDAGVTSSIPATPEHVSPSEPLPHPDSEQLDRSLLHGVAWTAGVKWVSQVASWAATLVVARLLTPGDYGIVAMATVYTGLVNLVNEFGLGTAIVKHRDLGDRQIAQISGLCVLFGVSGFLLSLAAAYPLAVFYRTPALVWVVVVLSVNFIISSFKTVPLSLLQRDLQFRVAALNDGVMAIVQSATMVLFAFLGFRYWTLVYGALLGSFLSAVLLYVQRPHRLMWPRRSEIGEAITFGSHIVGSRIGWYLYSNADFFITGRVLGQAALGNYSFGWTIASIPVEKVSTMIGRVTPSILSAVQNDSAALRRYVSKLTEGIALLTFPAAVGLALVAPDFVMLALGEKWRAAIVPLQLLAVYASFRSIVTIIPQVAQMTGLSRFGMWNALLSAVVMPTAFIIGTRWGIVGVAAAWIAAYPIVILPLYVVVFRHIEMGTSEYLRALWPALSSTVLMAAAVRLAQRALDPHWPVAARLAVQVGVGAAVYVGSLLVLHRERMRAMRELVRTLRGRAQSGMAPEGST